MIFTRLPMYATHADPRPSQYAPIKAKSGPRYLSIWHSSYPSQQSTVCVWWTAKYLYDKKIIILHYMQPNGRKINKNVTTKNLKECSLLLFLKCELQGMNCNYEELICIKVEINMSKFPAGSDNHG